MAGTAPRAVPGKQAGAPHPVLSMSKDLAGSQEPVPSMSKGLAGAPGLASETGDPLTADLVRFFSNCGVMKAVVDADLRAATLSGR